MPPAAVYTVKAVDERVSTKVLSGHTDFEPGVAHDLNIVELREFAEQHLGMDEKGTIFSNEGAVAGCQWAAFKNSWFKANVPIVRTIGNVKWEFVKGTSIYAEADTIKWKERCKELGLLDDGDVPKLKARIKEHVPKLPLLQTCAALSSFSSARLCSTLLHAHSLPQAHITLPACQMEHLSIGRL